MIPQAHACFRTGGDEQRMLSDASRVSLTLEHIRLASSCYKAPSDGQHWTAWIGRCIVLIYGTWYMTLNSRSVITYMQFNGIFEAEVQDKGSATYSDV